MGLELPGSNWSFITCISTRQQRYLFSFQTSATSIWSRLAALLNFLPSKSTLREVGLIPVGGGDWTQTQPLPEDITLRGFSPLLRVQEEINYCLDSPRLSMQVHVQCGLLDVACVMGWMCCFLGQWLWTPLILLWWGIFKQVNVLVHSTTWIWLGSDTMYYVSAPSLAIFNQL